MAAYAGTRAFACAALSFAIAAAPASASTTERDKAWDAAIAAAKAHGGVETKLDQSASYVFQRPDGSFLTLTHMFKDGKRSACLISKDQNDTVCFDWDTGKATYGERKDAASAWVFSPKPIPAGANAEKQGPLASLLSGIAHMVASGQTINKCCNPSGGLIYTRH